MTPEERNAYRRKTAERIQLAREKELEDEKAYFEKITTGTSWKVFGGFTFFCILLAIITTYDTFFDGEPEPISRNEYRFDRSLYVLAHQSVWIGDNLFIVPVMDMVGMDMNSFQVISSPILGDPKYLSFESEYEDTKTPLERRVHFAQKNISIYEWFPLVQLLLLIPLFVFLVKRQKPWFNFMRMTCFVLIFPGSLILLFSLIF